MNGKIIIPLIAAAMLLCPSASAEEIGGETAAAETEKLSSSDGGELSLPDTEPYEEELAVTDTESVPDTESIPEPETPLDSEEETDGGEAEERSLRNEVSVTDYGANGGDRLDDFGAIQAALNAVYRGDGVQRTVNVPDGVYYISDTLTIHSNTSLKLSDGAKIIRADETKLMLTSADDTGRLLGGYSHSKSISISGGEWDGDVKSALIPKSLFNISHASGITVKNTYIHDYCGSHGVIFNASEDLTVKNVTIDGFIDCRMPGQSGRTWYQEALHLDYASVSQSLTGNAVPLDDTPCRNVRIEGCTIKNAPSGVGTHHDYDGLYEDGVRIIGCRFENIDHAAVNAYGFRNTEISLNTAKNCLSFANMRKCAGKLAENAASLKTSAPEEDVNGVTDGHQVRIKNCDIELSGNVFKGGTNCGIAADEASSVRLFSNKISFTASAGIKAVGGCKLKMSGNRISDCGGYGMYASGGSTASMNGDVIYRCAKSGIHLTGAKKLSANSVKVTACGRGIYVSTSSTTLSGCTLNRNSGDAVFINSGSATVKKCVATENRRRGIVVKNASATVTSSKFYQNSSAEIFLTAKSKGTFKNTTVGGGGITRTKGSKVNLSGTLYRISESKLTLDKKSYKYTGKPIVPKVALKFAGKTLKEGRDYTVTLKNNKKRGKGSVTITGIGEFKGGLTAKFTIK